MGKRPDDLDVMQQAVLEGEALLEAEGRRLEAHRTRMVILGVCLVAFLLLAWLFRYDFQTVNGLSYLKLDRWTGEVHRCNVASSCD